MTKDFWLKLKLVFVPGEANNFRPKFLESRILFFFLIGLLLLKIITVPFLVFFPKSSLFADISKLALINLLNHDRQVSGLQPLKENVKLDLAAKLKAQDILEKDYFSHQSPEGITSWHWFKEAGYNYTIAGENLAIGFMDSREVQQAWLDSPSHKANLLNANYKDIGIAILTGDFQGNETTVVVQLFGAAKQTLTGPLVQTKEQTKLADNNVSGGVGREGASEPTSTFSSQIKSVVQQVKPAVVEEDKSSSSPFAAARLEEAKEKAAFNLFSFLSSDYHKILQILIYGFLGLIILALLINIFVRIDVQHIDLILKALGFIAVLVLFVLVDKEVIIKLIPHKFSIF